MSNFLFLLYLLLHLLVHYILIFIECRKLSLSSFLIMPVQRCPRYLLMLQDILKHTTKDVNAPPTLRTDVQEALLAIEQTNGSIDNAASRAKATEMLQKIQNKFEKGLLIVKPGRRLLSEDTMTVTMLSDTGGAMGESQQASVFLFNDLIMIGCPNVKRGRSMSSLFSSKKRGHTRSGTFKKKNLKKVFEMISVNIFTYTSCNYSCHTFLIVHISLVVFSIIAQKQTQTMSLTFF